MAWLTILTELLGGLAVLLGAFVTIICVTMTAVLLVAMFKVHLPYGFSSIKLFAVTATGAKFGPVGYEIILLYIACLAALVIGGSGPFAIDGLVRKRFEARTSTNRAPKLFCRSNQAGSVGQLQEKRGDGFCLRQEMEATILREGGRRLPPARCPMGGNPPALASIQRRGH